VEFAPCAPQAPTRRCLAPRLVMSVQQIPTRLPGALPQPPAPATRAQRAPTAGRALCVRQIPTLLEAMQHAPATPARRAPTAAGCAQNASPAPTRKLRDPRPALPAQLTRARRRPAHSPLSARVTQDTRWRTAPERALRANLENTRRSEVLLCVQIANRASIPTQSVQQQTARVKHVRRIRTRLQAVLQA